MKKVMKKKNYSNRFIYFLVTLGIFTLLAGGVYAISSVSSGANSGHPAGDIDFSTGTNHIITQAAKNTGGYLIDPFYDISGKSVSVLTLYGYSRICTGMDNGDCTSPNGAGAKLEGSAVSAGSFLYSSDKSLKTNIVPIPNALERLQQLNGVSFNWKTTGRADDGLIAQDVEKVFPELVSTDSVGLKSVEYGNLVGVLVEAIKEQQKQIDELKSRCK